MALLRSIERSTRGLGSFAGIVAVAALLFAASRAHARKIEEV
jgi:hypothetical protein